ncbi:hypothetical protein AALO_G00072150 [Alosa alosa]|uniref:Protein FAM216A n=1 Tax=Alosa alosa TaxID=278164 RepID=A0AAV6H2B1_9TELE|nr:protein FAM216A isoform X1 [Alosa alosa]KAG5281434.1 hypothetical protein AALO_G00072150 [Alosa alosa]
MRKQVTFLEEGNRERNQHGNSRYMPTRSAGSPHASTIHLNVDESNNQNNRTRKTLPYKPLPQQTAEIQRMKTIHIPKSMMMAPFLQHPSLSTGQKRYLCSIASVYSTEHLRRQMRQHYISILRSCAATAAGHRSAGRHRGSSVKAHLRGHPSSVDSGEGPPTLTGTNTIHEWHNNTAHSGKLVLPQITSQNSKSHRKVKSSKHASSKGTKRCTPYQQEDLEENLSSLSLEEEMDIVLN